MAAAAADAKKMKLMDQGGADGTAVAGVQVEDPSSLITSEANANANTTSSAGGNATTNQSSASSTAQQTPPSNILFAESLPKDCNEMMLACLFRSYPGYKEVRIPRAGLAFIEFDDEPHASVALKALNGFNLSASESLNLKYGKA